MIVIALAAMMVVVTAAPALAGTGNGNGPPGFGNLYYEDEVVRTVVPPAATPKEGVDDFYVVANGVEGQLGIAAVAPGDRDYHGGKWAFHRVVFNVAPYPLTSEAAVLAAAGAGDVTIERLPENDFKCPIQP